MFCLLNFIIVMHIADYVFLASELDDKSLVSELMQRRKSLDDERTQLVKEYDLLADASEASNEHVTFGNRISMIKQSSLLALSEYNINRETSLLLHDAYSLHPELHMKDCKCHTKYWEFKDYLVTEHPKIAEQLKENARVYAGLTKGRMLKTPTAATEFFANLPKEFHPDCAGYCARCEDIITRYYEQRIVIAEQFIKNYTELRDFASNNEKT